MIDKKKIGLRSVWPLTAEPRCIKELRYTYIYKKINARWREG
jgi:hypothetical protein